MWMRVLISLAIAMMVVAEPLDTKGHGRCPPIRSDFPLRNGGFEIGLQHWIVTKGSPDWVATTKTPGYQTPRAYLSMNNVSSTRDGYDVRISQAFRTCAQRNYTFSAFYRLPNNNVLYPTFAMTFEPGGVRKSDSTIGSWLQMTGSVIAPGPETTLTISTSSRNGINNGEFLVDSVVVGATQGA